MQSNEQLLVATQRKFIHWDGTRANIIQQDYGLYYGITWNMQDIFVVSREAHPHRVQVFDWQLNVRGYLPFKGMGIDPHQAFYYNDVIYVANRDRGCIQCMNLRTKEEFEVAKADAAVHYNSIWSQDGRYFWIVEHRQRRMPKKIRIFTSSWSLVATFNVFLKPQENLGTGMHNVYVEGNNIITLAPDQLVIVTCYDLKEGWNVHEQRIINLPGIEPKSHYLRGLARTLEHWYIGVSILTERSHRGEGDAWIIVLNNQLELVDTIELPNTGQITEVRAISSYDYAHNGLRCPCV